MAGSVPLPAMGINAYIALLAPVLTLAGCRSYSAFFSTPRTVESLEGDYLRLALCTYERP